jgi:hypothetical protein
VSKAIRYAAVTFGASLTSGAVAFAAADSANAAVSLIFIAAFIFGFLAFCAAAEGA